MARKVDKVNADPLAPARNRADWEAQGWASEAEDISAAKRLEATISIRFDPDSALLLRRAARLKGQTRSHFIRQATFDAARRTIEETQLPASMWISTSNSTLAQTRGQEQGIEPQSVPTTTTRGVIELNVAAG